MSDEFIIVATKEINEEITGISEILNSCNDDDAISNKSTNLQKHTHKIKGLAPMMGKESLGDLAALYDKILKQIMSGESFSGFFKILSDSIPEMNRTMNEADYDLGPIIDKTNHILSNPK